MKIYNFIPGIICIIAAFLVMIRLMHYAPFYLPSYFFWIGVIIALVAIVSLIKPLTFLFILNRTIAVYILCGGVLISLISLLMPEKIYHSHTNLAIDTLLPDYYYNEYHEIIVNASIDEVKQALQSTGVKDIPVVLMLMKIRGISEEKKDMSDKATNNQPNPDTFNTPDFNFIVANQSELYTLMILNASIIQKASAKTPPPVITTSEDFIAFKKPGYVKVAVNFLFKSLDNGQTLVSTETRNLPITRKDCHVFGRYWRIIYPGSAIIRRLWLDTLAQKAEKSN